MLKAILLQFCCSLSDPKLEAALARDIVVRRLVRLEIADSAPDHSTPCRFRNHPSMKKLQDTLLLNINEQLAEKNLYVKTVVISIVDASIIQAQRNHQRKIKRVITRKIRKQVTA